MSKPILPDPERRAWMTLREFGIACLLGALLGTVFGCALILWVDDVVWTLPPSAEWHDPDQDRLLRREAARSFFLEQEQLRIDKAGAGDEE